jgi:RHS repeat-associated protein
VAKPGDSPSALRDRYAPRWYVQQISLDAANRTVRKTTGSSVAALAGSGNESAVLFGYSQSGRLREASSSYGQLFSHAQHDATGLLENVVFAGGSGTPETQRAFSYDQRQRLSSVQTYRGPPELWNASSASYFPPPPGAPPTRQLLLEDTDVRYDAIDNVTEIRDWRLADEWPAGAKPVTRKFEYDDLYRLTHVAYSYPAGTDAWTSPFAAEEADAARLPKPSPHVAFTQRVLEQRYQYDWLGNTSRATDDANGFYDRSIGTLTNGTASAGPYQLHTASNRALAGPGATRAGDLDTRYDDAGNLIDLLLRRDGTCLPSGASCWQRFHYEWDEPGRLVSARRWDLAEGTERTLYGDLQHDPPSRTTRPPDVELHHSYDSTSNRIRKTAIDPAGHERHTLYPFRTLELRSTIWNDASSPPDYAIDSQIETVYLLAPLVTGRVVLALNDEPSQTSGHLRTFLELADYLGSNSIVIDRETGELVERQTYEAYGSAESDYRPSRWGSFRESYQFTGKEADIEVGLVYFGQRYYAPSLNRWISPDPFSVHGLGDDLNLYAYVHGSVANAVDPNGEFIIIGVIAAAAIVGAVIGGVGGGISYAAHGGDIFTWSGAGAVLSGALSGAASGAVGAVAAPLGPIAAGALAGAVGGAVGYLTGVPLTGGGFNYSTEGFLVATGAGLATGGALAAADVATGRVASKLIGKGIEKAFNAVGVEIAGTGGAAAAAGEGQPGPAPNAPSENTSPQPNARPASPAPPAAPKINAPPPKPLKLLPLEPSPTPQSPVEPSRGPAAPVPSLAKDPHVQYPPDDGFLYKDPAVLPPGTRIDRYGSELGKWFSTEGTPIAERSITPATTDTSQYRVYEVVKPLPVMRGPAAPWFGQPGMGTQYMPAQSAAWLEAHGYIKWVGGTP